MKNQFRSKGHVLKHLKLINVKENKKRKQKKQQIFLYLTLQCRAEILQIYELPLLVEILHSMLSLTRFSNYPRQFYLMKNLCGKSLS